MNESLSNESKTRGVSCVTEPCSAQLAILKQFRKQVHALATGSRETKTDNEALILIVRLCEATYKTESATPRSLKRVVRPRTPSEWCAYRCQLSCKIGRDALEGKTKTPAGVSPLEYAVYNLLHAVEELSRH